MKQFSGERWPKLADCLCVPLNPEFCQSGSFFCLVLSGFPLFFPSDFLSITEASVHLWKKKLCGLHLKLKRMPQLPFKFSNTGTAITEMPLQELGAPACFWWRGKRFFFTFTQLNGLSWFFINLSLPSQQLLNTFLPPSFPVLFCLFLFIAQGKKPSSWGCLLW